MIPHRDRNLLVACDDAEAQVEILVLLEGASAGRLAKAADLSSTHVFRPEHPRKLPVCMV